ncbi:MAG: RNA polymerase sigma factor [Saprospiraceae bacterium]
MKLQFDTEQELLLALQSTIPAIYNAALKYLYTHGKFIGAVRKQVYALGGDDQDVKIVLNEALLEGFNQIQDGIYDPSRSQIVTFIVHIATKKFYTKQRSESRRSAMHQRSMETNEQEENTDPMVEMDRNERIALINKALAGIGSKCQELLQLQGVGFSMAEIAEKLNYKNQNVAKMAAQDCRNKFRKYLTERPELVAEIRML